MNSVEMEKVDFAYMDSQLYKAAVEGKIKPFKENSTQNLELVLTPNKNTILHVNITSQSCFLQSTRFLEDALDICPSLLLQVNAQGDTPLCVAAKNGLSEMVNFLIKRTKAQHQDLESGIESARQMLRMRNKEGNTALHEAVQRYYSMEVVEILTKEDPDFPYSANHKGETPLYLAAARRYLGTCVNQILETCKSVACEGPNGKTALHAAVISDCLESTKAILEKMKNLTRETDEHGWTPLHYAAYNDCLSITQELLKSDTSAAYIGDKKRKMTPLLLAASQGNKAIMREIMEHCPDSCELVDISGWNVFHFAMVKVKGLKNYLPKSSVPLNLINAKDGKGNTPLHVLAVSSTDGFDKFVGWWPTLLDFDVFNNQNVSVFDIIFQGCPVELEHEIQILSEDHSEPYNKGVIRKKERLDEEVFTQVEKAKGSHLVVTTLIATVTFAAAFALPGGYKSECPDERECTDLGTAILRSNGAFQVFVISNAAAMILSLCAVFVYFTMSLKKYQKYLFLFHYAIWLTRLSMGAMVLAFVAGTYAALAPSLWLAISTCVIGLSFFLWGFFMVKMLVLIDQGDAESHKRFIDKYIMKTGKKK